VEVNKAQFNISNQKPHLQLARFSMADTKGEIIEGLANNIHQNSS
jgi:hypothetical protein